MTDSSKPTRQDAHDLLSLVEQMYALGGPMYWTGDVHDPDEWHGAVLSVIGVPANIDPAVFSAEAAAWGLDSCQWTDNAGGLRVLVRLSAAVAVAKTLRYVLGQPSADGSPVPATPRDVLDEICCTQPWLP